MKNQDQSLHISDDEILQPNADLNRLGTDMLRLYETSALADIEIKIGNDSIKAHMLILKARNEFFEKMFDHQMMEKHSKIVEIIDFDYETFNEFIKYLYSGRITKKKMSINMLRLADKYLDTGLKSSCENVLCKNINVHNAAEYLLVSVAISAEKLTNVASKFIAKNYESFKRSTNLEDFLSNKKAVSELLSQFSQLNPCKLFIGNNFFCQKIVLGVRPSS